MATTSQPAIAEPKRYKLPSRQWGITADEAGEVLVTAQEIKDNKKLYAEAIKQVKAKQKSLAKIT